MFQSFWTGFKQVLNRCWEALWPVRQPVAPIGEVAPLPVEAYDDGLGHWNPGNIPSAAELRTIKEAVLKTHPKLDILFKDDKHFTVKWYCHFPQDVTNQECERFQWIIEHSEPSTWKTSTGLCAFIDAYVPLSDVPVPLSLNVCAVADNFPELLFLVLDKQNANNVTADMFRYQIEHNQFDFFELYEGLNVAVLMKRREEGDFPSEEQKEQEKDDKEETEESDTSKEAGPSFIRRTTTASSNKKVALKKKDKSAP